MDNAAHDRNPREDLREALVAAMHRPIVIDANRFASKALAVMGIDYHAVGTPMARTR